MRIKTLLLAFVCLISVAHAQGTSKSKATLNSEVSSSFPDNSTGAITPGIMRGVFNDFIASWQQYTGVNAQAGTTYIFTAADYGLLVTFNNAAGIAVTLPNPSTTGFGTWNVLASNVGGTGVATITPTGSTIGGASSLTLAPGQSVWIISDGTNYQTWVGYGSGVVNVGTANQLAYYASSAAAVSGNANVTISGSVLSVGKSGTQGSLSLFGSSSGSTTIAPQAAASGTLSLPATTDTLVAKATTDTLTNKTYDTAGAGNVFKVNGNQISATTGSGNTVVASISPTITSPTSISPTIGYATFTNSLRVPIRTITAAGAVTVSATTDYFICVNKTVGASTAVNLPASPPTGLTYLIKDCKGDAAANNITVTPAAGNIDGSGTYVISTNYGSVAVTYDGSTWYLN